MVDVVLLMAVVEHGPQPERVHDWKLSCFCSVLHDTMVHRAVQAD